MSDDPIQNVRVVSESRSRSASATYEDGTPIVDECFACGLSFVEQQGVGRCPSCGLSNREVSRPGSSDWAIAEALARGMVVDQDRVAQVEREVLAYTNLVDIRRDFGEASASYEQARALFPPDVSVSVPSAGVSIRGQRVTHRASPAGPTTEGVVVPASLARGVNLGDPIMVAGRLGIVSEVWHDLESSTISVARRGSIYATIRDDESTSLDLAVLDEGGRVTRARDGADLEVTPEGDLVVRPERTMSEVVGQIGAILNGNLVPVETSRPNVFEWTPPTNAERVPVSTGGRWLTSASAGETAAFGLTNVPTPAWGESILEHMTPAIRQIEMQQAAVDAFSGIIGADEIVSARWRTLPPNDNPNCRCVPLQVHDEIISHSDECTAEDERLVRESAVDDAWSNPEHERRATDWSLAAAELVRGLRAWARQNEPGNEDYVVRVGRSRNRLDYHAGSAIRPQVFSRLDARSLPGRPNSRDRRRWRKKVREIISVARDLATEGRRGDVLAVVAEVVSPLELAVRMTDLARLNNPWVDYVYLPPGEYTAEQIRERIRAMDSERSIARALEFESLPAQPPIDDLTAISRTQRRAIRAVRDHDLPAGHAFQFLGEWASVRRASRPRTFQ